MANGAIGVEAQAIGMRVRHWAMSAMVGLGVLIGAQQAWGQNHVEVPAHVMAEFGQPPVVPNGKLSKELRAAVKTTFVDSMRDGGWGPDQSEALAVISASGDARLVWIIADLMRFVSSPELNFVLSDAAAELLEIERPRQNEWGVITDHLIAWDIPEPPGYLKAKRAIFTAIVPEWDRLFVKGDIDWRHVSWGGVLIDDRPFDETDELCNCIPAVDNPEVSSAAEATWLKESDVVFGIEVNGEARAYPRRIMEVREMVNDSLGGRDLGIPYCTLCGAAQAYFTDDVPAGVKRPVLRTSGMLIRSNKVMYDVESYSVFDTFLGKAVTGPLAKKGVTLKQASVVTTTWGEWRAAHPDTTVLVEALALGRDFDFRNGRDADGPIFPVGDVDPRLSVHEDVIGVVTASGTPVAFQRSKAMLALQRGEEIAVENVRLVMDGGGVKAVDANGEDLGSHQAFWFAWSQFYPGTELWQG
ncbi:DUF3179 domain-containing (seleno)protein [Shimia marina]|uniref:DUF3179 domain-containing protein n=1 Tax=Shimia marina TaxID=321267 RepID=A0A0P1EPZ0_9RHOB|nr:DUF3179 domain-containing (seleno)protein [Shimia marina]CUH52446.1 hypothetical protein SHM7688_01892 [Shimia marina]SFE11941.1 Protein of unknown function [Shimia marina]